MEIIIGVGIVLIAVATVVGFGAIGWWLDRHGGWHRWQVWLMLVASLAIVMGAIGLAAQPLNLNLIGLLSGIGALVGAVYGLFVKIPIPARSRGQRQDSIPRR